jgi:hypothetical protein
MTNGIPSLKETIDRLVAIRKELAATKKSPVKARKKGKRVKSNTPLK